MIRKLAISLAFLALATVPSHAGMNLMCDGEGIEADFPMGGGTGFSLMTAGVWLGDKGLRSNPVNAVPLQASWVDDRVYIDLSDPEHTRIVVRVRLVSASYWDVIAGVIEVVDVGAFPVTCGIG
jgi:hypothetical protein